MLGFFYGSRRDRARHRFVGARVRARTTRHRRPGRSQPPAGRGGLGGDALDRLDRRGGDAGRVRRPGHAAGRCRVPRWWRSSRSPSSPPPSACPPTRGSRTSAHALELRHRLPRVWRRVVRGDLSAWQARRIADRTLLLSMDAAAFVDAHVAPTAHKIGPYQLHALVEQAIADQFMPDLAEERRLAKADGRYFTIEAQQDSYDGTAAVHGELDLADAHDLETRRRRRGRAAEGPRLRRFAGCAPGARGRRAGPRADDPRPEPNVGRACRDHRGTQRQVVLYVHLTDAALQAAAGTARLERGNSQVTAGQVRDWCGHRRQLAVKPVIDLEAHDPVESPVVPDRHAELVTLRDKTCVFPWCNRPARRCDKDHSVPHNKGGPTCPCNFGATLPTTPPDQDPRRLDLPHHRARHLPVDLEARLPVPPRHHPSTSAATAPPD